MQQDPCWSMWACGVRRAAGGRRRRADSLWGYQCKRMRQRQPLDGPGSEFAELVRVTRSLLEFQGELGLRGLALSADCLLPHRTASTHAQRSEAPANRAGAAAHDRQPAPSGATASRTAAAAPTPVPATTPGLTPARGQRTAAKPAAAPTVVPSLRLLSPELRSVLNDLGECQRCGLSATRTNVVFGAGNATARLMFVGGAPDRDEDLQGEPFVGEPGQLLDRMIQAMGLSRTDVYLAMAIKCRPPRTRPVDAAEVAACEHFVAAQVQAVRPEVIVALGSLAASSLLGGTASIAERRGCWQSYHGVPVMPTYDPVHLLKNAADKRAAWDDLREVMKRLDLQPPGAKAAITAGVVKRST